MTVLPQRLENVRRRWRLLVRVSVAAPSSLFVATDLLGHPQAFFAPVSAIVVIIAGTGLRARALFELVLGVATGVVVGELLIMLIGRGAWQVGLVVAIALVVAMLLGLKGLAFNQAATSAVLLAAIVPAAGTNPVVSRMLDTLVGGGIGLLVVLLIPRRPVRDIDREVQAVLFALTTVLRKIAGALRTRDAVLADAALVDARGAQPMLDQLTVTARNVTEIARLAPARWRQRERVEVYAAAVFDVGNALRNARVMARKASALLRRGEPVPSGLAEAIDLMVGGFARLAEELAEQRGFDGSRAAAGRASQMATHSLTGGTTINGAAVAAQVRSLAADLMYATGLGRDEVYDRLSDD